MQKRQVRISKFLSLILRHKPEKIGLTLDEAGWAVVDDLLQACRNHGSPLILRVDSGAMQRDGHLFHQSANDVWLTDAVPSRYLTLVAE
jgi:RNA:NAD 2'-phosphotransferase (TPT1/KptA family)